MALANLGVLLHRPGVLLLHRTVVADRATTVRWRRSTPCRSRRSFRNPACASANTVSSTGTKITLTPLNQYMSNTPHHGQQKYSSDTNRESNTSFSVLQLAAGVEDTPRCRCSTQFNNNLLYNQLLRTQINLEDQTHSNSPMPLAMLY